MIKPCCFREILSFADAAHEPEWFTTAPTLAAPKALQRAGLTKDDVDYFEVKNTTSVSILDGDLPSKIKTKMDIGNFKNDCGHSNTSF